MTDRLYPFSRAARARMGFVVVPIQLSEHPEIARGTIHSVRVSYRNFRREGCTPKIARLAAIGLYTWRLGVG